VNLVVRFLTSQLSTQANSSSESVQFHHPSVVATVDRCPSGAPIHRDATHVLSRLVARRIVLTVDRRSQYLRFRVEYQSGKQRMRGHFDSTTGRCSHAVVLSNAKKPRGLFRNEAHLAVGRLARTSAPMASDLAVVNGSASLSPSDGASNHRTTSNPGGSAQRTCNRRTKT
jgi:hypothetical protein